MTLDERADWLNAIATQADVLLAEPHDILCIAGALLISAVSKLPREERRPALDNWTHHIDQALGGHGCVSRH